jgi:hypothetical protein
MRTLMMIAATLALGACATTHNTPQPAGAPVAQNAPANPKCAAVASRIPQTTCGPGQSYTQQDLQSTGQVNPAQALQMLDPAITAH